MLSPKTCPWTPVFSIPHLLCHLWFLLSYACPLQLWGRCGRVPRGVTPLLALAEPAVNRQRAASPLANGTALGSGAGLGWAAWNGSRWDVEIRKRI